MVAVVDSGVQADHPDLAGRIGPGYDVVQSDATAAGRRRPRDPRERASSARRRGNGIGVESVAPGATLMPVRVLGDDGGGEPTTSRAAID